MELKAIAIILFIPAWILLMITMYKLRSLTYKITGIKKFTNIKGVNDFIDKSFKSSDILLEIFFPKNYSKTYPVEFRKVRFFAIPSLILFIPAIILIFYIIFPPYFTNKKLGIPEIFFGIIILMSVLSFILKKYKTNK